ncbi:MAG: sialate O-acetylesterase [Verrucomicrobiota bacterium]
MTGSALANISDALIHYTFDSVNGTNLYYDWDPNRSGSLYHQMLNRVDDALTKLPQQRPGYSGKVAGFFWMQGEFDARDSRTDYQTNLTALIARVRTDFGNPNLPFIIGRNRAQWGDGHTVREAQAAVAAAVPYTYMVNTDSYPMSDSDHYSTEGTVTLATDFGNAYISVVTPTIVTAGTLATENTIRHAESH